MKPTFENMSEVIALALDMKREVDRLDSFFASENLHLANNNFFNFTIKVTPQLRNAIRDSCRQKIIGIIDKCASVGDFVELRARAERVLTNEPIAPTPMAAVA